MTGADVQVVGFLSLDEIVCPSGRFAGVPGGAAYYAAAAAARAGARVSLVACIGRDFPEAALAALAAAGVALDGCRHVDGRSRRSRIVDPQAGSRSLPHHDDAAWWEATERLAPPLPTGVARVSLFTAMPTATLARHLAALPEGALAVADTSTGYARREPDAILALLPRLACFAPSREETRLLFPEADDDEALARLAGLVALAVQKRGADGIAARRGDVVITEPSRAGTVVDTTGAGDSAVGAVAASLAGGATDAEALRAAARIAAQAVAGVGAAGLVAPIPMTSAEAIRT